MTMLNTVPATDPHQGNAETRAHAGKYLTFRLAGEEYGIEILHVQEIIGMMPVTPMPRTPDYVRGVVNLRGRIIPVVELRRKFRMDCAADTAKTCIIVALVNTAGRSETMGFIVDEVSEVMDIDSPEIEPAPTLGTTLDTSYILGMAKTKGSVKILVDIDNVVGADDSAVAEDMV